MLQRTIFLHAAHSRTLSRDRHILFSKPDIFLLLYSSLLSFNCDVFSAVTWSFSFREHGSSSCKLHIFKYESSHLPFVAFCIACISFFLLAFRLSVTVLFAMFGVLLLRLCSLFLCFIILLLQIRFSFVNNSTFCRTLSLPTHSICSYKTSLTISMLLLTPGSNILTSVRHEFFKPPTLLMTASTCASFSGRTVRVPRVHRENMQLSLMTNPRSGNTALVSFSSSEFTAIFGDHFQQLCSPTAVMTPCTFPVLSHLGDPHTDCKYLKARLTRFTPSSLCIFPPSLFSIPLNKASSFFLGSINFFCAPRSASVFSGASTARIFRMCMSSGFRKHSLILLGLVLLCLHNFAPVPGTTETCPGCLRPP